MNGYGCALGIPWTWINTHSSHTCTTPPYLNQFKRVEHYNVSYPSQKRFRGRGIKGRLSLVSGRPSSLRGSSPRRGPVGRKRLKGSSPTWSERFSSQRRGPDGTAATDGGFLRPKEIGLTQYNSLKTVTQPTRDTGDPLLSYLLTLKSKNGTRTDPSSPPSGVPLGPRDVEIRSLVERPCI